MDGLQVARAIEAQLGDLTEILIWTERVFLPGHSELVGGLFSHISGRASVQDQIKRKIDALLTHYEAWWDRYRTRVTRLLGNFQGESIKLL